jgi:hypothetical protein
MHHAVSNAAQGSFAANVRFEPVVNLRDCPGMVLADDFLVSENTTLRVGNLQSRRCANPFDLAVRAGFD